jgi:hypothetical protein
LEYIQQVININLKENADNTGQDQDKLLKNINKILEQWVSTIQQGTD